MARAIARLYAALLDDIDGVRLISRERLREVSAVAFEGVDEIFGLPAAWALEYSIGRPAPTGKGPLLRLDGAAFAAATRMPTPPARSPSR
jgi:hypothetical protein